MISNVPNVESKLHLIGYLKEKIMQETKELLPKLMLRDKEEEYLRSFQNKVIEWKSEENNWEKINFKKILVKIYILSY